MYKSFDPNSCGPNVAHTTYSLLSILALESYRSGTRHNCLRWVGHSIYSTDRGGSPDATPSPSLLRVPGGDSCLLYAVGATGEDSLHTNLQGVDMRSRRR